MSIFNHYSKALHGALSVKRYVVGAIVISASALYDFLVSFLPKYDIDFLPALSTLKVSSIIVPLLICWWFLQRIVELEKELEPQLDIHFEKDTPFEITEPMQANEHALRFCRVKVENKSTVNLNDCLAVLDDIRTEDGEIYPNRYTPVALATDHQFLENRRRGVFNLRGKQSKYVIVAMLDEASPNSEIAFPYADQNYPNTIPRGTYLLDLSIYGGGLPAKKTLKISVTDGYLSRGLSRGLKGSNLYLYYLI